MNKHLLLLQMCCAIILSVATINLCFSGHIKFDEVALGPETKRYQAVDSANNLIQVIIIDNKQKSELLNAYEKRGKKEVIFFLGNSQTHSINEQKAGEVNFIQILHNKFQNDSAEILCHSLPNGNLKEYYLAYSYWKQKAHIKALVIPIFFDDLREDKIRNQYYPALIEEHFLLANGRTEIAQKINANLQTFWTSALKAGHKSEVNMENNSTPTLDITLQEKVEEKLNASLENVDAWKNRQNIRGDFFVTLYHIRNTLFCINSGSIRKVIPQRYQDNMAALHALVNDCLDDQVRILFYVPPIRRNAPLPYDSLAYVLFKKEIKSLVDHHKDKLFYTDLDSIIPGELWGYKGATSFLEKREPDYMHFKYHAHQILADSLAPYLSLFR